MCAPPTLPTMLYSCQMVNTNNYWVDDELGGPHGIGLQYSFGSVYAERDPAVQVHEYSALSFSYSNLNYSHRSRGAFAFFAQS